MENRIKELRRLGLRGTRLAKAHAMTVRLKLLKIGTLIRVSVGRSDDECSPGSGTVYPSGEAARTSATVAPVNSRHPQFYSVDEFNQSGCRTLERYAQEVRKKQIKTPVRKRNAALESEYFLFARVILTEPVPNVIPRYASAELERR